MHVKFSILTSSKQDGGVEDVRTPMLMLTKIQGMGLGAGPRAVDNVHDGMLTQAIDEQGFKGTLAEVLTVDLGDSGLRNHLLLMGLGPVELFTPCGLSDVIEAALDAALEKGVRKLTVPVVANRMTSFSINLLGTAHIIRQTAERKLSSINSDDTMEIEFLCRPQAKRHITEGLAIDCKHRQQRCCKGDND